MYYRNQELLNLCDDLGSLSLLLMRLLIFSLFSVVCEGVCVCIFYVFVLCLLPNVVRLSELSILNCPSFLDPQKAGINGFTKKE